MYVRLGDLERFHTEQDGPSEKREKSVVIMHYQTNAALGKTAKFFAYATTSAGLAGLSYHDPE